MAAATEERSNCLGGQGCLGYFVVLDLLDVPGRPRLQPRSTHRQPRRLTRRQSDVFAAPCSAQPLRQDFALGMQPCRHARAPGHLGAPRRAPAPEGAPAPQGPPGAMERRHGAGRHRRRLGPRPRGTRTIARLPRGHQAAGGFPPHQGGVESVPPVHARHDAIGVVRHGPARASGAHRHGPLGCGPLNPTPTGPVTPAHACRPALAETGSRAPDTWTSSGSPARDAPRAAPVSTDQDALGLSRPGTG